MLLATLDEEELVLHRFDVAERELDRVAELERTFDSFVQLMSYTETRGSAPATFLLGVTSSGVTLWHIDTQAVCSGTDESSAPHISRFGSISFELAGGARVLLAGPLDVHPEHRGSHRPLALYTVTDDGMLSIWRFESPLDPAAPARGLKGTLSNGLVRLASTRVYDPAAAAATASDAQTSDGPLPPLSVSAASFGRLAVANALTGSLTVFEYMSAGGSSLNPEGVIDVRKLFDASGDAPTMSSSASTLSLSSKSTDALATSGRPRASTFLPAGVGAGNSLAWRPETLSMAWYETVDARSTLAVTVGTRCAIVAPAEGRWRVLARLVPPLTGGPFSSSFFSGGDGTLVLTGGCVTTVSKWDWRPVGADPAAPKTLPDLASHAQVPLRDYSPEFLSELLLLGKFELVSDIFKRVHAWAQAASSSSSADASQATLQPLPLDEIIAALKNAGDNAVPANAAAAATAAAQESYNELFATNDSAAFGGESSETAYLGELPELLQTVSVPGLSKQAQMALLGIIDTVSQVEKQRRGTNFAFVVVCCLVIVSL